MDFFIGQIVMMAINALYPGGARRFAEEGGAVRATSGMPIKVFVYHPNLSEDVRKKLEGVNEQLAHIELIFVDTLNFVGMDPMAVADRVKELAEEFRDTNTSSVAFTLNIDALLFEVRVLTPTDEVTVKAILNTFSKLEGIVRGRVVQGPADAEQVTWFGSEGGASIQEAEIKLDDRPARETVIQQDDITDLKIALEDDPWKLFES